MNEIYRKKEFGVPVTLEEVRQIYLQSGHLIGITLNVPRTKTFKRMTTVEQKKFLRLIFANALNKMDKRGVSHYYLTYEYCKDGCIHLHGLFETDERNNIVGTVQDIVKQIHRQIQERMKLKNVPLGNYHPDYKRHTSPSTVSQYMNDENELFRWIDYMFKDMSTEDFKKHYRDARSLRSLNTKYDPDVDSKE